MSDWQPIDVIPKDGSYVILWHPNEEMPEDRVTCGCWDSHGPYEKEMGRPGVVMHFADTDPTHWMPLNAPSRGAETRA